MESHNNVPDHDGSLLRELIGKAEKMTAEKTNTITAGDGGETPIRKWIKGSMRVEHLPDDPQGVLRISVGGNVGFGYCTFRGSRQACATLLRDALQALSIPPK